MLIAQPAKIAHHSQESLFADGCSPKILTQHSPHDQGGSVTFWIHRHKGLNYEILSVQSYTNQPVKSSTMIKSVQILRSCFNSFSKKHVYEDCLFLSRCGDQINRDESSVITSHQSHLYCAVVGCRERESSYPQPAEYVTLSSELYPSVPPGFYVSKSTTSESDAFAGLFFY